MVAMAPRPSVVASTVASWHTTNSPSLVAMDAKLEGVGARFDRPCRASNVLDGASPAPPWWHSSAPAW